MNDYVRLFRLLRGFCAALLLVICAGCAASSTTIIEEEVVTNPKPMYSYSSIVIRNLELSSEMYSDDAVSDAKPGVADRESVPELLSRHIERYIKSHNMYRSVSRDGQVDAATLVLSGKFTRLGRFKISIVISLRDGQTGQEVAYFRQTLWDVIDTRDSISDLGRDVADFIKRIQYK